jgi:hypothetical protein
MHEDHRDQFGSGNLRMLMRPANVGVPGRERYHTGSPGDMYRGTVQKRDAHATSSQVGSANAAEHASSPAAGSTASAAAGAKAVQHTTRAISIWLQ